MRIEVPSIAERRERLARKLTDRYEPTEPEAEPTEAPELSAMPEPSARRGTSAALTADAAAQGSPPPPDAAALFNSEIRQQAYGRRR